MRQICLMELRADQWFLEYQASSGTAESTMPRDEKLPDVTEERKTALDVALSRGLASFNPDGAPERSPESWEEIYALCELTRRTVLIETQTFDTFLCTVLEMFWACDGDLVIGPDYTIKDEPQVARNLFRALYLLCLMFENKIIRRDSSVEFVKEWPAGEATGVEAQREEWLFARHWYSTLVDMLTARDKGDGTYRWRPAGGSATLTLAPLPYNLSAAAMNDRPPAPVSCWGEWHFALLRGSENEALAIDLINNLMSSHRICERAFNAAAIPTVTAFYDEYGHIPCLEMPERKDVTINAPTYRELRDRVFKNARSRNSVFDYRHCMRDLHALVVRVQKNPAEVKPHLGEEVLRLLKRIGEHVRRETMIH